MEEPGWKTNPLSSFHQELPDPERLHNFLHGVVHPLRRQRASTGLGVSAAAEIFQKLADVGSQSAVRAENIESDRQNRTGRVQRFDPDQNVRALKENVRKKSTTLRQERRVCPSETA